jgi:hypothetical protein
VIENTLFRSNWIALVSWKQWARLHKGVATPPPDIMMSLFVSGSRAPSSRSSSTTGIQRHPRAEFAESAAIASISSK